MHPLFDLQETSFLVEVPTDGGVITSTRFSILSTPTSETLSCLPLHWPKSHFCGAVVHLRKEAPAWLWPFMFNLRGLLHPKGLLVLFAYETMPRREVALVTKFLARCNYTSIGACGGAFYFTIDGKFDHLLDEEPTTKLTKRLCKRWVQPLTGLQLQPKLIEVYPRKALLGQVALSAKCYPYLVLDPGTSRKRKKKLTKKLQTVRRDAQ